MGFICQTSAKSVGTTAAAKLLRWNDEDVASFSLGFPQLACFLSAEEHLSPLRAAALLSICEDHGWHEWSIGDGLSTILPQAKNVGEQKTIFEAVFKKLTAEHSNGGWSSLWESMLTVAGKYPGVVSETNTTEAKELLAEAERKRHEFNSRSSYGEPPASITSKPREMDPDEFVNSLVAKCDPASAASIDESLKEIEAAQSLPYFVTRNFFEKIRETCAYGKRLDHLLALAEAANVPIEDAIDQIQECVSAWASSSTHVVAEIKNVISHLFKSKGSELFNIRYGNVTREMKQLTELCDDAGFVLRQVLNTIASERVELDGEQWLQLATSLSKQASKSASREALENFLSGPAAGLADEIGEGPYQAVFSIEDEQALVIGIMWHLLGDDDVYIKWSTARALSVFAELGLIEELDALLAGFDRREVPALKPKDHHLSFQNSQQWLLMGLARAALIHGAKLAPLKQRLHALAARKDVHILHKVHMLRCLKNIGSTPAEIASLEKEVAIDPKGVAVVNGGWPKHVPSKSGFTFDYEFNKTEVSRLARVFRISDGPCIDAIAHEIQRLWPQATNMDAFPGIDRYRRDRTDRYENYRDHVQKHGMLSAATTLRSSIPVARDSYDQDPASPFAQWLNDYDVTFNDGSWLSDHKDEEPDNVAISLLGPRVKDAESIIAAPGLFKSLGLLNPIPDAMLPIYGHWKSPDGVNVQIVSALGMRRGIVGLCEKFSKRSDNDLWLPMFYHDGVVDPHRQASPFEPFVWMLENYAIGMDAGEKIATSGVASRPRLGVELQTRLGLTADKDFREWKTADNKLALRSQVWGGWVPDPDNNYDHHRNENGEILWADPDWLTKYCRRSIASSSTP